MLSVYSHSPEKTTYLLDKAHFPSDVVQTDLLSGVKRLLVQIFHKNPTVYNNTHFIF